jgi:thiamine pyrophosphate-dependent acetolactate synthase large subunit-like protein
MARKTVAQVIVDALVGVGVERVYGVAGDSLNGITDAIYNTGGIDWMHVRHEEAAALRLFVDCSHFCETVSDPSQIPRLVEIAIQTAAGMLGVPVHDPEQLRRTNLIR